MQSDHKTKSGFLFILYLLIYWALIITPSVFLIISYPKYGLWILSIAFILCFSGPAFEFGREIECEEITPEIKRKTKGFCNDFLWLAPIYAILEILYTFWKEHNIDINSSLVMLGISFTISLCMFASYKLGRKIGRGRRIKRECIAINQEE